MDSEERHNKKCADSALVEIPWIPAHSMNKVLAVMPRAALEDLLAQRSTLNSRLTSLQHAAARVQRRQRRVAKAEAATAIQKRVCVCLYLLNKCESGCARDYLKKCGIADIEVAMDEVVKMFVAMDDLEADSVLAHTSPAFPMLGPRPSNTSPSGS